MADHTVDLAAGDSPTSGVPVRRTAMEGIPRGSAGAGLSQWLRGVEDEIDSTGRQLGLTRTKRERLITIGARV